MSTEQVGYIAYCIMLGFCGVGVLIAWVRKAR